MDEVWEDPEKVYLRPFQRTINWNSLEYHVNLRKFRSKSVKLKSLLVRIITSLRNFVIKWFHTKFVYHVNLVCVEVIIYEWRSASWIFFGEDAVVCGLDRSRWNGALPFYDFNFSFALFCFIPVEYIPLLVCSLYFYFIK